MFDPISIFYLMIMLNSLELPSQRLNVDDIIKAKESMIIHDLQYKSKITIREGINENS